jgi:hypothetical protein
MSFKIRPFKDLVAMSKEKLDEAMVPLRVRAAKAKAEGEIIKLEERMISLEASINEQCAKKELNFSIIADQMDEYDLIERRLNQINSLVANLFPAEDK